MKITPKDGKKNFRLVLMLSLIPLMVIGCGLTVFLVGKNLPTQYDETYYGELSKMYDNIKNTKEKKIVIVGNSNIPFGVDSALMEELLQEASLDYKVCNFGLYGTLGTKMMLDLSKKHINKDDIVIFIPELSEQPLSLYFSAEHAWYSLDCEMGMFNEFDNSTKQELAANYFSFVSEKNKYIRSGEKPQPSGIYASSSFDSHCDLKNYERRYNIMNDGYDSNNMVEFNASYFGEDFVSYVNSYYSYIKSRGAEMYFSFSPINKKAIVNMDTDKSSEFFNFIADKFDFPVMSNFEDYVLDSGWFYDTNFHLNESGMALRTYMLVNDLKNQLGNTTKTEYALPEMPIAPQKGISGEGDNSCQDYFNYHIDGNYYIIDSLNDAGSSASDIVVPYQVDGLYVKGFLSTVFAGDRKLKSIRIQKNVSSIINESFGGCTSLEKIIFDHTEPSSISVGGGLIFGTSAKIYVPKDSLSKFMNDYNWGKYAKDMVGY